jgi:hypothetical protein
MTPLFVRTIKRGFGTIAMACALVTVTTHVADAATLFDQSFRQPGADVTFIDNQQQPGAVCGYPRWVNGRLMQQIAVVAPSVRFTYRGDTFEYYRTQWRARVWDLTAGGYVWTSAWSTTQSPLANPVPFPNAFLVSPYLRYDHYYEATVEVSWTTYYDGQISAYRRYQIDYLVTYPMPNVPQIVHDHC